MLSIENEIPSKMGEQTKWEKKRKKLNLDTISKLGIFTLTSITNRSLTELSFLDLNIQNHFLQNAALPSKH